MRISRTFIKDHRFAIGWGAIDHPVWLTLCNKTLNKFWELEDAKRIEVVLSSRYSKEALGVGIGDHNEGDYRTYIDGVSVGITSAQEEFLCDFFPQRSFYMSVWILEDE